MGSWTESVQALAAHKTPQGTPDVDAYRRLQYARVEQHTGRPLIVYATDFLNKQKVQACGGDVEIDLSDRDGLIEVTRGVKSNKADVLIYSPGGLPEAADSLVHIIRNKFKHVRYIIPSVAKSAATMMALSADEILMEENAELGPIDPQFRFVKGDGTQVMAPAQAIIDQFEKAQDLIGNDTKKLAAWIPILQQYGPSLYQQSINAIDLAKKNVREYLKSWMFKGNPKAGALAGGVVNYLGNHNAFKSHGARVGIKDLVKHKVKASAINDDPELLDRVMSTYFAITLTFGGTGAYKIFENSSGHAMIRIVQVQQIQFAPPTGVGIPVMPVRPGQPAPTQ